MSAEATGGSSRVAIYDDLRVRLERADELSSHMREALRRADAPAIDEATSRLETLALEFKLLHDEFARRGGDAPSTAPPTATRSSSEGEESQARQRLARTATRLTRTAAVHGGLLERLVTMSTALADTVQSTRGEPYGADGRAAALTGFGTRLREQA